MTSSKRSICVFCGSKNGTDPDFKQITEEFAKQLVQKEYKLVYGGGAIGLMGAVANKVKSQGGHVTGIIPKFLDDYEVGHTGLDELILTPNMHTRKEAMFEKSDGFVILPGGLGTMDETFEILTWKQLQLHQKPIVLFNYKGFWNPFVDMMESIIDNGFAHEKVRDLITIATDLDQVFDALEKNQVSDDIVLTSHF